MKSELCLEQPMDMTSFVIRSLNQPLRELGKTRWITFSVDPDTSANVSMVVHNSVFRQVLGSLSPSHRRLLNNVREALSPVFLGNLAAVSKLLADGPKIFCPTMAQCEAMEQVSIELTVSDYQQAFPAMAIELPIAYVNTRKTPRRIVIYHDDTQNIICTHYGVIGQGGLEGTLINDSEATIEEQLSRVVFDDTPENSDALVRNRLAERVAINCMLALTQYNTRLSPFNPLRLKQLRADIKSASVKIASSARDAILGEFEVIGFTQEIDFIDKDETSRQETSSPSLRTLTPHWRKGHWRRQRYGTQRSETKLIFIKPMLIRRDQFKGDVANTSVTYSGKARVDKGSS